MFGVLQVVGAKVGEGPHYLSESKEVQKEEEPQLLFQPARPVRGRGGGRGGRAALEQLESSYSRTRHAHPATHTDSWLEKHFGSTSSLR